MVGLLHRSVSKGDHNERIVPAGQPTRGLKQMELEDDYMDAPASEDEGMKRKLLQVNSLKTQQRSCSVISIMLGRPCSLLAGCALALSR